MRNMFGNIDRAELEKHIPSPADSTPRLNPSGMSGAVKSMQHSFSAVEAENEQLRTQLRLGGVVVELDPANIIPSFVKDRLDIEGSPQFKDFVESIRREGQKHPILVRPTPDNPEVYQVAYGHRRLRACLIIGIPVRAIVRSLTDEQLVLEQGIENTERENLSFIEQALFAAELKRNNFSRETIAKALGRSEEKGLAYISFLTSTVSAIPESLIRKIGPAPGIGRPKWDKLGSFFKDQKLSSDANSAVNGLVGSQKWQALGSDERFEAILGVLDRTNRSVSDVTTGTVDLGDGVIVAIKQTPKAMQISIPHASAPGLSSWLIKRLPALMEEFKQSERGEGS